VVRVRASNFYYFYSQLALLPECLVLVETHYVHKRGRTVCPGWLHRFKGKTFWEVRWLPPESFDDDFCHALRVSWIRLFTRFLYSASTPKKPVLVSNNGREVFSRTPPTKLLIPHQVRSLDTILIKTPQTHKRSPLPSSDQVQ